MLDIRPGGDELRAALSTTVASVAVLIGCSPLIYVPGDASPSDRLLAVRIILTCMVLLYILVVLVWACSLIVRLLKTSWSTRLVLTSRRLIIEHGGSAQPGPPVPSVPPQLGDVDQTLWQRCVGTGDLLIVVGGDVGETIPALRHPYDILEIITTTRTDRP